MTLFADCKI